MSHAASQNELADMLRYMRPSGSATERAFIQKWLEPLGAKYDRAGNAFVIVDNAPILWSSHTDTVHHKDGKQDVIIRNGIARSNSDCLGADCTTGVWLMVHMIRNKVPGLYMFHDAEEKGCIGSGKSAKINAKELKHYKYAVAFDRKYKNEVITYQRGSRCCSDEFAKSLGDQLCGEYTNGENEQIKIAYALDDNGVYTDTAEYTGLIAECTNISVGYVGQHTKSETQDVDHALWLADKLCHIDIDKLVCKRVPGTVERKSYGYSYAGSNYGSWKGGKWHRNPTTLYDLCIDEPWYTSKALDELGIKFEQLNAKRLEIKKRTEDAMYKSYDPHYKSDLKDEIGLL